MMDILYFNVKSKKEKKKKITQKNKSLRYFMLYCIKILLNRDFSIFPH